MENLNNQKHYMINIEGKQINTIEIINAILENLGVTGKEAFHIGNVLKYVIRYKHKGNHEDLNKAMVYLEYVLGIKSRGDLEEGFKMEIKDLLLKNAELEIDNERLRNEIYNNNLDFEKEKKELKEETKEEITEMYGDWAKLLAERRGTIKKIINEKEKYKKQCQKLAKHIEDLNEVICEKDNKIYELTKG